jgi:hypothetical protein
MKTGPQTWKKLLLFSLGLTLGAAFCMKFIEAEFDGFSILGLELFYNRERIAGIFDNIDDRQLTLLRFNLVFDFAFMAGIYPLIASLCMLAKNKTGNSTGRILTVLALLQIIAWVCDILENIFLLNWSYDSPVQQLGTYHVIVWIKWMVAIAGVVFALLFIFRKPRTSQQV